MKTYLSLIATAILWGSAFVATKIVLSYWPAWAFMFARFFAASLLFFVLMWRRGKLRLPPGGWWKIALIALFEPALYFVFETLGLEYTSAASVSIIIAGIPAAVALASGVFLGEHLHARGWIGALVSIAGIVIIALFVIILSILPPSLSLL